VYLCVSQVFGTALSGIVPNVANTMAHWMEEYIFKQGLLIALLLCVFDIEKHFRQPASGSFLRSTKIDIENNIGQCLLEAANSRYTIDATTIDYDKHSFGVKQIEIVGMQKVSSKQKCVITFYLFILRNPMLQ
jgi:hypothetical protein